MRELSRVVPYIGDNWAIIERFREPFLHSDVCSDSYF